MATLPVIPQPSSTDQITSDMVSSFLSSTGIGSPSFVGSATLSLFEATALAIARASGDVFSTLLSTNLAYATSSNLQAIAQEFNISIPQSLVSTGAITVTDISFQKISTTIYPLSAVNIGSTVIYVGNASQFPASGSIYIGRGTNDSEGPLAYSSWSSVGNYYQINLSQSVTKFHNIGESVILSQGGTRTVPVNTIASTPSSGLSPAIQFIVTQQGTILDGEVTVSNIPITSLLTGSSNNVASNTITLFSSPPFSGATVTNPSPTSGGQDPATNDQIRTAIQNFLSTIGPGASPTALKNSLIGVTSISESATITADSFATNTDGSSTIYIDTGGSIPYEAKTAGVGIEYILTNATGGEQFFQLETGGSSAPVAKAFLQSVNSSPFAITGSMVLAVDVGGVVTEHVFATSDFAVSGSATAYEIAASINADVNLNFQATTSGNGSYVVIRAIANTHDSIQVVLPSDPSLINANNYLLFPSVEMETLRLYKNSVPLNKDGNTASVFSQEQSQWSVSGVVSGINLILSIDNTSPITYTFTNSDFIGVTPYNSVASTNSLDSWITVMNNKLTGVTASISGAQIELTSNLGASSRAKISIDSASTMVTSGKMFGNSEALTSIGATSDYTLDRNTAQIQLTTPLSKGDNLTAGVSSTRGFVKSSAISGGSINFSAEGYIWVAIDTPVIPVGTGVVSNSLLSVSVSGNTVSYQSSVLDAFQNVEVGDYVIIWSQQLNSANRLEGRVHSITTSTQADDTLNIVVTASEASSIVPQSNVIYFSGFVVVRTENAPQKFNTQTGTQTLDDIVQFLQAQTNELIFSVYLEEYLIIATNTLNTNGSVFVVTSDPNGQLLSFADGQNNYSSYPTVAYQDTSNYYLPSFFHSKISADTNSNPPDSFISSFNSTITPTGHEPNEIVTFLNPYGGIDDEQPENEQVQESNISGSTIDIIENPDIRRLRQNDRYFLSSTLNFGASDNLSVVVDNNPSNNTYSIPLYRHALTNTTYGVDANNFNAYDKDLSNTGSFVTSFGSGFSFENYKVLMQAKNVLSSTTLQSSILYRSISWGLTGTRTSVTHNYSPSASVITSSVSVTNTIAIVINVPPSTTASSVVTYVNANLKNYISAVAVNDGSGGSPGTGIITATASCNLLDGLNYLISSDISGSPQFTFKTPLSLPSATGYSFNNGETILFIPTTVTQVNQFINTLAVSGITTSSVITSANRNTLLEISSDSFGSNGYIDVVGGPGNSYSFPLIDSALNINNQYSAIFASSISSTNVLSGQWFYLSASNAQQKDTLFGTNTDVTITPNSPSAGLSTISVSNIDITQRYFGKARNIDLNGLTFRVENQGKLVCFSWTGSGSTPQYLTQAVDFNASGGGTLGVSLVAGTNDARYTILSGAATFTNINIGDIVTVSGLSSSGNNGTFIVTGSGQISSQWVLQVTNTNAAVEASDTYSGSTFSATTGAMEGDTVIIGSPLSSPNQGSYRVIRTFNDSFWIENLDASEEEVVLTSNSLKFYEYEATVPGDKLVISGTAFGVNNAGTYAVAQLIDQSNMAVTGVLTPASSVNLTGLLSSFYINEGIPYTGYKRTYLVALQPSSTNQNIIVFDTLAQYEKLDSAGNIEVKALGKLGFETTISQGLDGYKYNTGLIQESNKVLYGDPADTVTYQGIVAAGTDVYVDAPLVLVINDIAVDVRLQTGTPFNIIVQQVQSNIASYVNSNLVGQSIAISNIIASITTIPGIISVAISSPSYSVSNDLIVLQQNQKAFILQPTNVSVSQIT